MSKFTPFFINSNLCVDESRLKSFESFMDSVAKNTGNAYITYSLIKELGGVRNKNLHHINNIYNYNFNNIDKDAEYINQKCSHVFLILQDQIRIFESYGYKLPYSGIISLLERINKPVIIVGLGANSLSGFEKDFHKKLDPELISFLQYLSYRCNLIGVRGYYTEEVLQNIGIKNVEVIGCPSYYEMGENRVIVKKTIESENDIVFTSIFPPMNKLEEYLNNYIVMQDMQEERFIKKQYYGICESKFNYNELYRIKEGKYRIFSNIDEWKNFMSQFSFAIGYRVHGSIISMNAGTLAMCCNGDSRAREMCELMSIPYDSEFVDEKAERIIEIYNDIDINSINKTYKKLYSKYRSFLKGETGIDINKRHLSRMLNHLNQPSLKPLSIE